MIALRRWAATCVCLSVVPTVVASAAVATPLPSGPIPAQSPATARASPTIRLVLDLQCPHSRRAWPVYRAQAQAAGAQLLVHHLPLSRHPLAAVAGHAALAARLQGAELLFVDALLQQAQLDDAGIAGAAVAAGLDLVQFERDLRDPATVAGLQREKQAALAFGVQATPSALVAGRGLGGVPAPQVLLRQLAVAARRMALLAAQLPAPADLERAAVALSHPDFLAALDALRSARFAASLPADATHGWLGQRYRVEVLQGDVAVGSADAAITVAAYVDSQQPWTIAQLTRLRQWQAASGARLIVRVLPGPAKASHAAALWWAAAALATGSSAPKMLEALPADRSWSESDILQAARTFGLDSSRLTALAAKPEATAQLHAVVAQAQRIDAGPGAVFVNGRRWLGLVQDGGWQAALTAEAALFRSAGSATGAYALLVRDGKWRQDAELDLQEPIELGDLTALPKVGSAGPELVLLVDFSSPASRAAWHMVRRWTQPLGTAGLLRIAALPGHGQKDSAATEVLLAAAELGKASVAVDALFDGSAWNKLNGPAVHAWAAKKLGVPLATWQRAQGRTAPQEALQAMYRLRQCTDWGEEPVIFLVGRLYTGPLDEARLERALRFAAKQASAQPLGGGTSVAQEAP